MALRPLIIDRKTGSGTSRRGGAPYLSALRRLKGWTRERFSLPEAATVLVSEESADLPGFPPLQTLVSFWTDPETRYAFKVFKPLEDVVEDDLPPSFMKRGLLVEMEAGCSCC